MEYLNSLKKSNIFPFFGSASRSAVCSASYLTLTHTFPNIWHQPLSLFLLPSQFLLEIVTKSTLNQLNPFIVTISAEIFICLWQRRISVFWGNLGQNRDGTDIYDICQWDPGECRLIQGCPVTSQNCDMVPESDIFSNFKFDKTISLCEV